MARYVLLLLLAVATVFVCVVTVPWWSSNADPEEDVDPVDVVRNNNNKPEDFATIHFMRRHSQHQQRHLHHHQHEMMRRMHADEQQQQRTTIRRRSSEPQIRSSSGTQNQPSSMMSGLPVAQLGVNSSDPLLIVNVTHMTVAEQLLLATLQGRVAQRAPALYLCSAPASSSSASLPLSSRRGHGSLSHHHARRVGSSYDLWLTSLLTHWPVKLRGNTSNITDVLVQ